MTAVRAVSGPPPSQPPTGRQSHESTTIGARPTSNDVVVATEGDHVRPLVPRVLRVTAALGWRLLVVVAAAYVVGVIVARLAAVVVPVAVAVLLAALLAPAVSALQRHGVPRSGATVLVMVGGLSMLGGVLTFVVVTFVHGIPALAVQLSASVDTVVGWLATGPLQLSSAQLAGLQAQILITLSANQASITSGALTTAATLGETVAEMLLVVFVLIFLLHGGAGIWQFLLGVVPRDVRTRVDVAGRRGLAALVSYVRATAVVAVVDAAAIGIGLAVLGVPLGGWCRTAETSVGSAGWVGHTGSHAGWAGAWSRFG